FVNQGGYKEIAYPPFDQLWQRMKRYALASHNYDESEKLGDKKRLALMNWTSHAQLQVGASERIFEMLSRKFGIPRTRQEVWTNPISFNSPATVPTYPGPLHGNYIFSMLAELDIHRKAQDLLIRALSSEKWSNRNWELHLFGTGRDKESLAALIAEKKMENKIFLKGFTPDPQKALEETHVLLQCTRIDAMPVSVVEAMALGRPCVVSAVGDMPLWIREAHNGFVCRDLTVEAIDDVLEKCWSKKEKWAEIGKNAFETFQSKYPAPFEKAMVRKIIDLLSSSPAHVKDDPGQ
ncbi:MAG TPA: glycosyltransferase family 4 protein, partial [Allocoleopsis sp.]